MVTKTAEMAGQRTAIIILFTATTSMDSAMLWIMVVGTTTSMMVVVTHSATATLVTWTVTLPIVSATGTTALVDVAMVVPAVGLPTSNTNK